MNKKQTGLALLCFLGLLASSSVLQAQEPVEIMAGEILLKFKSDTPEAAKRTFEKEFDLNLLRESKATGVCLYQSKQDDVLPVVERIKKSPLIEFAEPNYVVKKNSTPNDPLYGSQWHLPKISMPETWNEFTGSNTVKVAVIDSGVNKNHPDLAGVLVSGGEWDYVEGDGNAHDVNGHGTLVAGVIAAIRNNSIGISGITSIARILPIRTANSAGLSNNADNADAIERAAINGCKVINCSFGSSSFSNAQNLAINYANSVGALVVCAAGNGGNGGINDGIGDNNDVSPSNYPSSYSPNNIIAVANTTAADVLNSSSNYGLTTVDIAAPGTGIISTVGVGDPYNYPDPRYDQNNPGYRKVIRNYSFNSSGESWQNYFRAGGLGFFWNVYESGWVTDYYISTWQYAPFSNFYLESPLVDCRNYASIKLITTLSGNIGSGDILGIYSGTSDFNNKQYVWDLGFGSVNGTLTRVLAPLENAIGRIWYCFTSDGFGNGYFEINNVEVSGIPFYESVTGTSFSSPIVAGVAALLMSQNPSLTHLQVKDIILQTARKVSALNGKMVSGGVVDAVAALREAKARIVVTPTITSSSSASGTVGSSFSYTITASGSPTSYNASGLPSGVSVNTSTGAISGTPTSAGTFSVSISASNSAGTGSATLTLTIAKGTPSIAAAPTATPITYGQSLSSSSLSGGSASVSGTFSFTTPSTTPSTGSSSHSVTFTPTSTANYNTATTTVSVTVNKATPSITTPPTAGSITRGQTLASSALIGGSASVAGTFAWTTSSIAPNVGTSGQSVTFTPTDTGNYNTTTTTVNVTVNKGTPTITAAPTAGKITYGQTLASSTLSGGSANVAGRFTWTSPTQAPQAGTPSLSVTFTPNDTANYGTATTTVSLVVDKKLLTGGFTVSHKEYDRNNSATVATRTVNGRVGVDDVNHTGGTATFNSSAVGNNRTVTLSGATLTGAASGNYTLGTIATTTANITPKALTITGALAASRSFNGSTTVTVSGGSLSGVVSGDTVTLGGNPTGTMANANAGTGKAVTVTGYTISGASAANYVVAQPTGLTVNITKATPTISRAPTARAINQGQALSSSALSGGTASVAGMFAWTTPTTTPSAGNSNHSVTFTPTDVVNYNTTTTTVSVVVNPPPPVITSNLDPVTITNRASYSYTITASGSPTAFEAAGLPQGLSVNRTSGLISGSPTQNGTFTVTLRALRSGATTGTATKVFTVVPPPMPVINSDLSGVNIALNANYSYQITASGSPTSYGATGLPSGLSINTTTGIISGKPNKTGTSTVTLQALKTGGTTGTATKVFNVVQAPSFSYAGTNTFNLNASVNIRPTVTGFPAPTFSVISGSLPAGLSLNTTNAAITGKPTARGTNAIVVRGSNSAGNTDRTTTIVVR